MDRLKIGIVFGGCSEEYPVSVKSAQEVAKNLDAEKYEPFWIGITKSGAWKLCDGPAADWEHGSCRPAVLSPDRSVHGLLVLEQGKYEAVRWCPFCTASLARTVPCKACWSSPASPTQAAISKAPPCAWTSPSPTWSPEARESLRRISGSSRRTRMLTPAGSLIPSS